MTRPLSVLLLFLPAIALARVTRFDMRDGGLRNLVEFISDAQLEKTVGISNALDGWMELDPDKLTDGVRGELQVDVRTFETGIELRNEHIRDKILGGNEFPLATFRLGRLASVSSPKLGRNQRVVARVEGTLNAKGLSLVIPVLMKLTYLPESETTKARLPGNLLKVSASFEVDLSQFNVVVPEAFKARVARFVQVNVDAVGTDRPPAAASSPHPHSASPNGDPIAAKK